MTDDDHQVQRLVPGGEFIFDWSADVQPLWGDDGDVLWARGEGFMLCGPQGVGKSTLMQRLVLHRAGIFEGRLLDLTVEPTALRVLYLAMDRPAQIGRSFRRMVSPELRERLDERLMVWRGPLPFSLDRNPAALADLVEEVGATDLVVDSLKDIAHPLTNDETAAIVNSAFQEVIARQTQVGVTHHLRKAGSDNRDPSALDDVYGSTWLTAGLGSVVLLKGKPGDSQVRLHHLKQPASEVGPFDLQHDHDTGAIRRWDGKADVLGLLEGHPGGLTTAQVAEALYGNASKQWQQRATRRLQQLVKGRLVEKTPGTKGGAGGGGRGARWKLATPRKAVR